MNILLTGASGQLGRELRAFLAPLGELTGVDRDVSADDGDVVRQDLADFDGVTSLLEDVRPGLIVNAAAYTAVDAAEDDPDTAFRLNAELPGQLARWSGRNGALMVHYSTDYVFAGDSPRPYVEEDPVAPLNVYGETKRAGETAVMESGCGYLLLRTSWVYSSHGHNFVLSMLRLAAGRDHLRIVDDQRGCPTWARNLARASRLMIDRALLKSSDEITGLYHYCDRDAVSWHGFAAAILDIAGSLGLLERAPELEAITSKEFRQKAQRPANSVLDAGRAVETFGIEQPGLAASLQACLEEIQGARR